jgi:hypothetical protein
MATVIYPTSASLYTRIVGTTGLTELHIDLTPNIVMVLTGSFPNTSSIMFIQGYDTGSTYPITASAVAGGAGTNFLLVQIFS